MKRRLLFTVSTLLFTISFILLLAKYAFADEACARLCAEQVPPRMIHLSEPERCICSDHLLNTPVPVSVSPDRVVEAPVNYASRLDQAVVAELRASAPNQIACSINARGPGDYVGLWCRTIPNEGPSVFSVPMVLYSKDQ